MATAADPMDGQHFCAAGSNHYLNAFDSPRVASVETHHEALPQYVHNARAFFGFGRLLFCCQLRTLKRTRQFVSLLLLDLNDFSNSTIFDDALHVPDLLASGCLKCLELAWRP